MRVRNELLPLLDAIAGRDVVPLLNRQSDLTADLVDAIDILAAGVDPTDAKAVAGAHPAVARWALRTWIRTETASEHPVDAAALERVLAGRARRDAGDRGGRLAARTHRRPAATRGDPGPERERGRRDAVTSPHAWVAT